MIIRRLEEQNGIDWSYYPVYERRVREFCEQHLLTETDIPKLLQELRVRWLFQPQDCGYFALFNDAMAMKGHVAAWVAKLWDRRYVYVYQWEMENAPRETVKECFRIFLAWIKSTGLDSFEFQTPHEAKVFIRYLSQFGIESLKIRSVIRAKVN